MNWQARSGTIYLTDGAQELAGSLREGRQRVAELIEIYDRWPEEQAPPARAGGDAATDEMLRSVRRRMGIAEEGVNEIEDIGDALNAVLASPSHPEWAEWHQAKLRAIRSGRPKKLVALRHFTEADFSDA